MARIVFSRLRAPLFPRADGRDEVVINGRPLNARAYLTWRVPFRFLRFLGSSSSATRRRAPALTRAASPPRLRTRRYNFKGGDQQKRVGDLSGGERNRLQLAKTLLQGGNLLMLDEPTNDLDVDTLRCLEDAIQNVRVQRVSAPIALCTLAACVALDRRIIAVLSGSAELLSPACASPPPPPASAVRRLRRRDQPRPVVPRPPRDAHPRLRGRLERRVVRGVVDRVRRRPEEADGAAGADEAQVPPDGGAQVGGKKEGSVVDNRAAVLG